MVYHVVRKVPQSERLSEMIQRTESRCSQQYPRDIHGIFQRLTAHAAKPGEFPGLAAVYNTWFRILGKVKG